MSELQNKEPGLKDSPQWQWQLLPPVDAAPPKLGDTDKGDSLELPEEVVAETGGTLAAPDGAGVGPDISRQETMRKLRMVGEIGHKALSFATFFGSAFALGMSHGTADPYVAREAMRLGIGSMTSYGMLNFGKGMQKWSAFKERHGQSSKIDTGLR